MNVVLKEVGYVALAGFLFFGLVFGGISFQQWDLQNYLAHGDINISVSKERPQAEQVKAKMQVKIEMAKQDRKVTEQLKKLQEQRVAELRQVKTNNTSPEEALKFNESFKGIAEKIKKSEQFSKDVYAKKKALEAEKLLKKISKFKDQNPSGKKVIIKDLGKNKTCDVRCQLGK